MLQGFYLSYFVQYEYFYKQIDTIQQYSTVCFFPKHYEFDNNVYSPNLMDRMVHENLHLYQEMPQLSILHEGEILRLEVSLNQKLLII